MNLVFFNGELLEKNDMLLIQCNSDRKYKKVLKTFKTEKI